MRVLSLVELPHGVAGRFHERFDYIEGRIHDAQRIQPDVVLCSIGEPRMDAKAIAGLPASVLAIATYSVGHDHIDLMAAKSRGIAVFNTPGVLTDAVADAAMLLILGAARRATESIALLRGGKWPGWSPSQLLGVGLQGRTLGILGMGSIGQAVAERARAFGMKIAYHNRTALEAANATYFEDPEGLLAHADIILLAWPSTPQTRHYIRAETLALCKPSAILINIGRGDLLVDSDLVVALRDGILFAAGLDVFDNEPDICPEYFDLPNAFLLPHVGSSTWDARCAMADTLVDALTRHMAGEIPTNRIA